MKTKAPLLTPSIIYLFLLWGAINPAHSATDITTFTNDINTLISEGNNLVALANSVELNVLNMQNQLANGSTAINDYLTSVQAVYDSLNNSTTMSLTNESLVALQTLSSTIAALADGLSGVASQMVTLAAISSLSALESSLASMLSMSHDIGAMADRIGEMADRILLMADNIGVMADRILATQLIQNNNIELAFAAILETQKNALMLFSMYSL